MNTLDWWIIILIALTWTLIALFVVVHIRKLERVRRDEEWLESYFAKVRADKACRDRLGKFIPATQRKADLSREEAGYIKKHGDKL